MQTTEIISLLPSELQPAELNGDDLQKNLASKVLYLLRKTPDNLFSLLYLIDLDEAKVKNAFKLLDDTLISEKIAELIILRLHQKAEIKKRYSSNSAAT